MTDNAPTSTVYDLQRNRTGLTLSIGAALLLYTYLFTDLGWRQASLFLVGLAAGIILYHITQLSALPPPGEKLRRRVAVPALGRR